MTQLFVEALVLGGVGTSVGLATVRFGMRWGLSMVESEFMDSGMSLPFWIHANLSASTVLYAALLTLMVAVIAGVVPALKVTRGLQTRLREAAAGGGGLRFGGLWTGVIVTQVAVTVAFPVTTFFVRRDMVQIRSPEIPLAAEQFLSVRLEMPREATPSLRSDTSDAKFINTFQATYRELERRLEAEPVVSGVTFAERLPRMYHDWHEIELDQGATIPLDTLQGHRLASAWVDADYFDVLGVGLLSGREFRSSDLAADSRVAIVNESFVEEVLGGRNPLGRMVRWSTGEAALREENASPWHEIVGVVTDLGTRTGYSNAGVYVPLQPASTEQVYMAVHVMGDAMSFSRRLRVIATETEPGLRLEQLQRLDHAADATLRVYEFWLRLSVVVSAVALLLSLSGIYAVTSFAVARRTREIGIRVALGEQIRLVVLTILRRPLTQVGLGVLAGGAIAGALSYAILRGSLWPTGAALVALYAAFMMGVCMLACLVPTMRALRVEPTQALSTDS